MAIFSSPTRQLKRIAEANIELVETARNLRRLADEAESKDPELARELRRQLERILSSSESISASVSSSVSLF